MPMILEGIRILDWTTAQQGPVSTTMLADLGADVIKIESPEGELGRSFVINKINLRGGRNFYFEANNRNKRDVVLDLKKPEARDILYKLVEKSDVFVQNWRKGVAARLGVDYQTLCKYNPKIIYASGSPFGPEGPEAGKPGLDIMGAARSGLMLASDDGAGEPNYPEGALADQTGAILLAWGILAALVARERHGIGQEVHSSLMGGLIFAQGLNVMSYLILGKSLGTRNRLETSNPLWNTFKCADGKWLVIAGTSRRPKFWSNLCQVLEIGDLVNDPRFTTAEKRAENKKELVPILDKVFATKPREEWLKILCQDDDLLCTHVDSIADLGKDPQVLANRYIVDFEHPVWGKIQEIGFPVTFSKMPGSVRKEAPMLGEHTEEVLVEVLGYSWDDITRLKEQGVIQ